MSAPLSLDLEAEVRELFHAKLREFAAFCAENWQLTDKDLIDITVPSEHPTEYLRGYNAAITDGLSGAIDCWLDETGYAR